MASRSGYALVFCCTLSVGLGAQPIPSFDNEAAIIYSDAAQQAYVGGDRGLADAFVERALAYDDSNSDARYLRALIALETTEMPDETAIVDLELAVAADRWRRFDRIAAVEALAPLYLKGDDYEALATLLTPDVAQHDADLLYWRALAYSEIGIGEIAQRTARHGMVLFPTDARFWGIRLQDSEFAAIFDLERFLRIVPADRGRLSVLLRWALMRDPDERVALLERYLQMGGDDPIAVVSMAESLESIAEGIDLFRLFDGLGGMRYKALVERLYAIAISLGNGAAQLLQEQFQSFEGEMILDDDRDGVPERRYRFEAGELRTLITERFEADILDREPVSARLSTTEGADLTIEYILYPMVSQATLTAADGGWIQFALEEQAVRLELLNVTDPIADGQRLSPDALVAVDPTTGSVDWDRDWLVRRSFRVEEYRSRTDERPWRVGLYDDGMPTHRMIDRNTDGRFDSITLFALGEPVGLVSDIDFDGLFEVDEEFGAAIVRSIDADDDFIVEYINRIGEPVQQSWDFDEDGEIDLRQLRFADGRIEYRYGGGL